LKVNPYEEATMQLTAATATATAATPTAATSTTAATCSIATRTMCVEWHVAKVMETLARKTGS